MFAGPLCKMGWLTQKREYKKSWRRRPLSDFAYLPHLAYARHVCSYVGVRVGSGQPLPGEYLGCLGGIWGA